MNSTVWHNIVVLSIKKRKENEAVASSSSFPLVTNPPKPPSPRAAIHRLKCIVFEFIRLHLPWQYLLSQYNKQSTCLLIDVWINCKSVKSLFFYSHFWPRKGMMHYGIVPLWPKRWLVCLGTTCRLVQILYTFLCCLFRPCLERRWNTIIQPNYSPRIKTNDVMLFFLPWS